MLNDIKALIVVLAIAAAIFKLAKPTVLLYTSAEDFSRRRLIWFVLTVVGFISPNLWLYAIVAVPLFVWAGRKDSCPIALYLLLLQVVPPVGVTIPIIGNNGLFDLDNYKLLGFCVLLPAIVRARRDRKGSATSGFGGMDVLLLAFGALQVALYTPPDLAYHYIIPDSPSNALRRGVLFILDIYFPYYAVSRLCQSKLKITDSMASFWLACALMAALAVFERTRNWLLYVDITGRWGTDPNATYYLVRGGSVRAQVSAGHSLSLGFLLALGSGFWLYLKSHVQNRKDRIGGTLLLWLGLFAAFSRGAWLGTVAMYFSAKAIGPRAVSRLVKGASLAFAFAALVAVSPLGDQISAMLPRIGQPADPYRHKLAERGWELVFAHPFFGDQFPWPELEELRQGEGIIDIVNTYLGVALNYGFVGLFLFLSFILVGMTKVYARARDLTPSDPDLALLGKNLIACLVGVLFMIDSCAFILGIQKMFYVLAGFTAAYALIKRSQQAAPSQDAAPTLLRKSLQ